MAKNTSGMYTPHPREIGSGSPPSRTPVSHIIFAVVVVLAILAGVVYMRPAIAQDNSGFRALGEAIGGQFGTPGVYEDAYREGLEVQESYWNVMRARQEANAAVQQQQMIELLGRLWVQVGLSPDEAAAVAGTFQYTPDLDAIVLRAKHEGSEKTLAAAGDAYRGYQYLLANQLLIAGLMARNQAPPPYIAAPSGD